MREMLRLRGRSESCDEGNKSDCAYGVFRHRGGPFLLVVCLGFEVDKKARREESPHVGPCLFA